MNLPVKYRPKRFDELIGQEHISLTLYNALKFNKVANAYLFTGPRGVGKTTTARILAKGLNCRKGVTPDPCNECDVCVEIDLSRSMDVLEIDGASNRGIDEVRSIKENVILRPLKGRKKVYIIDEVHMLTQEAFNALLKTLEEPPEHVVFIMATTEPRKVPETVRSRTLRFDFKLVPEVLIHKKLREISEKEGISVDEKALELISRKSEGSVRDAIRILEEIYLFKGGHITPDDVNEFLGILSDAEYQELFGYIKGGDVGRSLEFLHYWLKKGINPQDFAKGVVDFLSNLLRLKASTNNNLNPLKEYVENFSEYEILGYLRIALETEEKTRYSSFPTVWLEYGLASMANLPRVLDLEEYEKKLTYDYSDFLKYLESTGAFLLKDIVKTRTKIEYSQGVPKVTIKKDGKEEVLEHLEELREEIKAFFGVEPKFEMEEVASPKNNLFLKKLMESFELEKIEEDVNTYRS